MSMRSERTLRGLKPGNPVVQVSPGRATGSGCTARNVSVNPVASTASEIGQRTGYGSLRAAVAGAVQSRQEGALKSAVSAVGVPAAIGTAAARRIRWTQSMRASSSPRQHGAQRPARA